jgi:hypothetical protein
MEMDVDIVLNRTNSNFSLKMIGTESFKNPKTNPKTKLNVSSKNLKG